MSKEFSWSEARTKLEGSMFVIDNFYLFFFGGGGLTLDPLILMNQWLTLQIFDMLFDFKLLFLYIMSCVEVLVVTNLGSMERSQLTN